MSIGHHINDRGHVIEKKHNKKSGEREFNQDFQNMDESKYVLSEHSVTLLLQLASEVNFHLWKMTYRSIRIRRILQ